MFLIILWQQFLGDSDSLSKLDKRNNIDPSIQGIPLIRSGNELEKKSDFDVTSANDSCLFKVPSVIPPPKNLPTTTIINYQTRTYCSYPFNNIFSEF